MTGELPAGTTSKDVILRIIGEIGTAGGTGHVMEFCGSAFESLSMEARMSVCNMAIEAGARAGMVAPDAKTVEYVRGRPLAPKGEQWDSAVEYWLSLASDVGAKFDTEVYIDGSSIIPTVTWGTSPQDVVPITGCVPDPAEQPDATRRAAMERALNYMGLEAGTRMEDVKIDKVFIGSCTNSRIEDLREAAKVACGRKVAEGVSAMVVPGSGLVKMQAEAENLHEIFIESGFEWREAGCSMCLGMNPDQLAPGERCASTSNRNFEGRQGRGGRTHLVSPAMAAAAAVTGSLTDVRTLLDSNALPNAHMDGKQFATQFGSVTAPPAPTIQLDSSNSESAGMTPFTKLSGVAAPLPMANIDTDMIIPKQFLKTIKRSGLGVGAFYELRYIEDGTGFSRDEKPDFVLNQLAYKSAVILITGENFGCGSSREHAPWAILDMGIRCLISTSFADIFFNNCMKNGMVPIKLTQEQVDVLMVDAQEQQQLTVDLETQTITRGNGETISFDVDQFRRHCLLNGLDDIGLTMQKDTIITAFEEKRSSLFPWLDGAGYQTTKVVGGIRLQAAEENATTHCGCAENETADW